MFRQVDRADFMVFPDEQDALEAYEDHAWRRGKLHLSAPCIYTRAMEALNFKRGWKGGQGHEERGRNEMGKEVSGEGRAISCLTSIKKVLL